MSDVSQFCVRQPAACEIGSQAATVIGHRAQAGARKVYQMITDKKPDHTGSIGRTDEAAAHLAPADTLTSEDLKADWRGPITDAPATDARKLAQDQRPKTRPKPVQNDRRRLAFGGAFSYMAGMTCCRNTGGGPGRI